VLPIGGLKEKLLAAHRANLKTVVIPKDNEKDLAEVPANVVKALEIIFVEHMDEVMKIALLPGSEPEPLKSDLREVEPLMNLPPPVMPVINTPQVPVNH
jgi:ATP-dependent Lon protease